MTRVVQFSTTDLKLLSSANGSQKPSRWHSKILIRFLKGFHQGGRPQKQKSSFVKVVECMQQLAAVLPSHLVNLTDTAAACCDVALKSHFLLLLCRWWHLLYFVGNCCRNKTETERWLLCSGNVITKRATTTTK